LLFRLGKVPVGGIYRLLLKPSAVFGLAGLQVLRRNKPIAKIRYRFLLYLSHITRPSPILTGCVAGPHPIVVLHRYSKKAAAAGSQQATAISIRPIAERPADPRPVSPRPCRLPTQRQSSDLSAL